MIGRGRARLLGALAEAGLRLDVRRHEPLAHSALELDDALLQPLRPFGSGVGVGDGGLVRGGLIGDSLQVRLDFPSRIGVGCPEIPRFCHGGPSPWSDTVVTPPPL
jgi:hypothetical protein